MQSNCEPLFYSQVCSDKADLLGEILGLEAELDLQQQLYEACIQHVTELNDVIAGHERTFEIAKKENEELKKQIKSLQDRQFYPQELKPFNDPAPRDWVNGLVGLLREIPDGRNFANPEYNPWKIEEDDGKLH